MIRYKADNFERLTLERVQVLLEEQGCAIGLVDPDEYHKWKKVLPNCVSKSSLVDFEENPLRYKMALDAGESRSSAGFKLGGAVDAAVLTPEVFARKYWYEPKEVKICANGKPHAGGHQSDEQKARWAEREARGDVMLKVEELKLVSDMAMAVSAHLEKLGLLPGESCLTQVAMFVRVEAVNNVMLPAALTVCGMLDVLPLEDPVLLDLKTTSRGVSEQGINYALCDYSYGVQAAMYADLYQICTGEDEGRRFAFLFADTVAPHQTRLAWVPATLMVAYRARYQAALEHFSRCVASGDWGGLQLPDMDYNPPRYELNKLGVNFNF